jgi:hypothetical protein
MGTRKRIISLEEKTHSKKRYIRVNYPGRPGWVMQGDTRADDVILKTEKEVEEFGERPDVDLVTLNVVYRDQPHEPT